MKNEARAHDVSMFWRSWADGDFYLRGLASDGRTGRVIGAPDVYRRLFLERSAIIEPQLLMTLRMTIANDESSLSQWGARWNLNDLWCRALAQDTARWYAARPDARGWEFENTGIFAGHFPFAIEPLRLGPFYYDPTWRRRAAFKEQILGLIVKALEDYCDRTEAAALVAGLIRAPRKREVEHLDWLARYQVRSESFASIARTASFKFKGGRQTVRKAIVEFAEYIELTLRPST
jgi:hypothetical protein